MLANQPAKKYLTLKLALCAIALSSSFAASKCSDQRPVKKSFDADIWNIDPTDGSIYRRVKTQEGEHEEFILCTDKSARGFKAMTDADFKKWMNRALSRCVCK